MKLHLPKGILAALLIALANTPLAQAGTGWGSRNGDFLYVGGTKGGDGINTTGVGTVTWDNDSKTVSIDSVSAIEKGWTDFGIVSDIEGTAVQGSISELSVKENANVKFCENPWRNGNTFNTLTISQLLAENSGNVSLSNELAANCIVISQVTGVVSSVTNAGTLTIGTEAGVTTFGGTITNTGTMTVNGAVNVTNLANFTIVNYEFMIFQILFI